MDDPSTRVDRVDARSTDQDQDHVLFKTSYNSPDFMRRGGITHTGSTARNLKRRWSGRVVHRINQGTRGLNPCVITATIKSRRGASRSSDQDPTDAILSIFKCLSMDQIVAVHHDPKVTT